MRDIYVQAVEAGWLGESRDEDELAVHYLPKLAARVHMTEYNPELVRSAEFAEATGIPQPGSPASIALG